MKSIRETLFGKKKLESFSTDELRRLILLGESKERTLLRQLDEQEKAKERIFKSVTSVASSDRQKRHDAERIAAMERTIQSIDQTIRGISAETRLVRRVLEVKEARAKKREKSFLERVSATDLARLIEQDDIERKLREENVRMVEEVLDGVADNTFNQYESPQVMEIMRQIREVAEKNLGLESQSTKTEVETVKGQDTRR